MARNIVRFAFKLLARNLLYTVVDSHIVSTKIPQRPIKNPRQSGIDQRLNGKKASVATITLYRLTSQVNAMRHHLTYVAGEKNAPS